MRGNLVKMVFTGTMRMPSTEAWISLLTWSRYTEERRSSLTSASAPGVRVSPSRRSTMWAIMVLLMISSATVFMKLSSLAWLTRMVSLAALPVSWGLSWTLRASATGPAAGASAASAAGGSPRARSKYSMETFLTPSKSLRTESGDSAGVSRSSSPKGSSSGRN